MLEKCFSISQTVFYLSLFFCQFFICGQLCCVGSVCSYVSFVAFNIVMFSVICWMRNTFDFHRKITNNWYHRTIWKNGRRFKFLSNSTTSFQWRKLSNVGSTNGTLPRGSRSMGRQLKRTMKFLHYLAIQQWLKSRVTRTKKPVKLSQRHVSLLQFHQQFSLESCL